MNTNYKTNVKQVIEKAKASVRYHNIYLNNCGLTSFPLEICELEHITDLNLGNNPIRTLPPEIKNLKRLKNLTLHNTDLKNCLLKLESLQVLNT